MSSKQLYNRRSLGKQLSSLGLSTTQSTVYLALLTLKKSTVLEIARETHIQRPTIYDALHALEDYGLVQWIIEGSKKYITPNHPENIALYLEKKKQLATTILPTLEDIYETNNPLPPKIRFFQGTESLEKLADTILTSESKVIRTLADYEQNIQKPFSEKYLRTLWEARTRKHILGKILYTHKSIPLLEKNKDYYEIGNIRYNREIRILPQEIDLTVLYTLVDNNVLFWSSQEERYSFHIKSPSYAQSLTSLFDFLWSQSKDFF